MSAVGREVRIDGIYPLSPLQEGILFHSLAAPEQALYVVQPVFALEGDLDVGALRRAADHLVARHAALRTAFAWEGRPRPLQVVYRDVTAPWEERALDVAPGADARAALSAFLEADRARVMDLAAAPLVRFALLTASDGRRWLTICHHHLVLDGWSMPIVTRDLAGAYAAFVGGREPDLAPARQFGDYVAWLGRQDRGRAEAFWRDELHGLGGPTPLAADTLARAAEGGEPVTRRARAVVPGAGAAGLRALSRRHRLVINTVFQGAWAALLSRYGGERDVVFGAVVSGRTAALDGVDSIVGMFVNSLPVRVAVDEDMAVLPWLLGLQARFQASREHEHCALTQIQAWSGLAAGSTLFETLLAVQTMGPISPDLEAAGLSLRPVAMEERVGLPLTIMAHPGDDGIYLGAEYDGRRFPAEAVSRLLGHYGTLLAAMAARPQARLGDLPLLAPSERERLVAMPAAGAPSSVPDLLARAVRERPGAPAVTAGGHQLTYAELDAASARVAAGLLAAGVGPESAVGVRANGVDALVPVLGVLRAGAACLPLAAAPGDLAAVGLVVQPPEVLDGEPPATAVELTAVDGRHAAWVARTAGLGQPVVLTGEGVAAAVTALAGELGLGPGDRMLARSALATTDGMLELLLPLAAGAELVAEPAAATFALGPVSFWTGPSPTAVAVVTGEPLPARLAERLPRARSLYGPAGLPACCLGDAGAGAPLPGVRVHVLDRELRLLPAGVTGDVWVAGPIARCASGPTPTADRFRPDPFGPAGGRMLRTGDRARIGFDGRLELVGPALPGWPRWLAGAEAETVLGDHPAVARALAAGGPDGPALAAELEAGAAATPGELRAHVRRHLPSAAVPATVRVVDRLPLTPDGRADRDALAGRAPHRAPPAGAAAVRPDDLVHRLAQAPRERRGRFLAALRAELDREQEAELGPRPHGAAALSAQQEQFWVLERLAEGESAHNLSFAVDLDGGAGEAVVRRALAALVARHEVLRSSFRDAGGRPELEVAAHAVADLALSDVTALSEHDRAAEAAALAVGDARRPFDLARPPMLRARLVRLGRDAARLVVVVPHLVADPRSVHLLAGELARLCREGAGGDQAPGLQYPDYAWWQRRRLASRGEHLLAYWQQQLDGWRPLELPLDHARPARLGAEGSGVAIDLDPGLVERLRAVGRARGAGLDAVLLAGFAALLARWAGQDDVLIGASVDLRDRPELETVIGDFGNHVVLRLDTAGGPGFGELVARAARVWDEAMAHGELPFARLVEALQPVRDPGRTPIFQVAYSFDAPPPGAEAGPSGIGAVDSGRVPYELALHARERGGAVGAALAYNRNLFDAATVRGMAACLERLLPAAAADPERPLADLDVLPPEQGNALAAWTDGGAAPWPDRALHELVAERAGADPHALAVRHAGRSLPYGELAAAAARLAGHLRALGARPEDRVAVLLERGQDLVTALLAVLWSGAAYVPLDPAHPPGRLRTIVRDAGVRLAVTRAALAEPLIDAGCAVVDLDEDPAAGLPEAPPARARPEHLAYVLYTSGSTGVPKGILVEHRAAVNFVTQIGRAYGVGPGDRMLAVAPATFDLSVFELFTALTAGASVHVASEDDRLQPDRLQRLLEEERVTVAELPPALMPLLRPDALPDLRLVSVGGEAFPGELVDRWWAPTRRFVNGYGPSETTVAVTLHDCEPPCERMPPIGRPMANHHAHVLDVALRPVPVGVPGELCLAGVGLARGYAGRPDQTAERFVPDPFSADPGRRLYRTGDRARWLPSGRLEFLGRLDRQVKVRGHRVELGEIEAVLARQPGVRQAAVEVHDDAGGSRQLVAYLAGEWRPDVTKLRERLGTELPAYLLPTRVVLLDRLPLTSRGKVDRRALPPPAAADAAGVEVREAPRTWVEERIASEIFGALLQVPGVDVETNFFELGGNSLEAIQVVSRVRDEFGVEVGLAEFLMEPTVRRLGALVEQARTSTAHAGDLLDQIVQEVEALSDEEAERMLRELDGGREP